MRCWASCSSIRPHPSGSIATAGARMIWSSGTIAARRTTPFPITRRSATATCTARQSKAIGRCNDVLRQKEDRMPESILNPEEVAAYRRDGYVVPRFRLEGEALAGLQQAVAQLVEDNP